MKLDRETIYTRSLESSDWVALLMTRYHGEAVEIIRALPESDRFFYQVKVNRFKQFSIWCVRGDRGGEVIERLKTHAAPRVEPLIENHADR
jgi:hypothetical protein